MLPHKGCALPFISRNGKEHSKERKWPKPRHREWHGVGMTQNQFGVSEA